MNLRVSAGIEVSDKTLIEDAKKALALLVEETLKETGCILFEIHQNLEKPERFILWEIWEKPEDLAAHFEMDHTKKYLAYDYTAVNYIEKMGLPLST